MPLLPDRVLEIPLPMMHLARQAFASKHLDDVSKTTYRKTAEAFAALRLPKGSRVAIGVGSRGIANLSEIVKAVVRAADDCGMQPTVVAAMGSHGGGRSAGQRAVLEKLGITEQRVGAPIRCEMEVETIGETDDEIPIMFDRYSARFDAIVPINRVKPHTDFFGPNESGLCKMLAIGFADHEGCSRLHQEGFARFADLIPRIASHIIDRMPIAFGIAVVENAYDQTLLVEAIAADRIVQRESELLRVAYRNMPEIPFSEIDVLIVDEIGKDISGAGMDPNIIGRTTKGIIEGYSGPSIKRIVVRGITPASNGNAIGVGLADFVVQTVVDALDTESSYANAIASGNPESARIPIVFPDTESALRASLLTAGIDDWRTARIVRIRSTLDLAAIHISDALIGEAAENPRVSIVPNPIDRPFSDS